MLAIQRDQFRPPTVTPYGGFGPRAMENPDYLGIYQT